jgi:regulator of protease activity HflC (stomatin/prohibitin superfamily)
MNYIAKKAVGIAVTLVVGATTNACSYAHIGSGEVGVVQTPEGMNPSTLTTGDWRVNFWDRTKIYTTRSQEQAEDLEVLAANGLKIVLAASIRYHIVADEAVKLDQELGEHYYATLLGPTLRSQSRRVVGRYQPEEIYSTEREAIERQIREGVDKAIAGRHIVLEAVLIRNVRLPDAIQAAINTKLEAEQSSLKMKYVLEQAKAENEKRVLEQKSEAERQMIMAQSSADALRLDATAHADAKRIEGAAQDAYQKSIQLHLSDMLLRFYQVEATKELAHSPNSKLVFLGGGGRAPETVLDLRGAGKVDVP